MHQPSFPEIARIYLNLMRPEIAFNQGIASLSLFIKKLLTIPYYNIATSLRTIQERLYSSSFSSLYGVCYFNDALTNDAHSNRSTRRQK